ncbi:MAG: FAD-dependent monooxygenase [Polaromonas sp.]
MRQTPSNYLQAGFSNGYEFSKGSGYKLPEYPFTPPPELTLRPIKRHDIVIVGAGLAGLTLACALNQYGIQALLLDEDNTVGVKGASSRGICYAQKTLEIFKRLGIYDRIAAKGVQWSVGRTFAGNDEVYSFDLASANTHNVSTQPPFINIQQFYVEGFLVEQLYKSHRSVRPEPVKGKAQAQASTSSARTVNKSTIDLRWHNRITAFEQNAKFATLSITTPAGDYKIQATHVIDCSGARSPFRTWVDASVTAKKGDDRWCIADVRFKKPPPVERHTWIEAPYNEGRAVWQHLMADGVWRIDYQMRPDADPEEVSREAVVRDRINGQLGRDVPHDEYEIVWVGPYAYRSECLDQLRHGRVFFVGDAAHVVSPFGARGGNSGVQDADNLAWKLAAVANNRASSKLLDSYHDERHEAATQNVQVTNRTARFLRPADGMERVFRTAAISLAKRHAFARQLVNTGRMSTPNTYSRSSACMPTGGRALPNVAFKWSDGSTGDVADLLTRAGGRLTLLLFGVLKGEQARRIKPLTKHTDIFCVNVLGADMPASAKEHVRDPAGHLAASVGGAVWALLRPDSYVAATGQHIDQKFARALCIASGDSL